MFSSRTNWNLTPNPLSILLEELKAGGQPFINLTESNPTACGFEYPQDEILQAFHQGSNLNYAAAARGMKEARQAVSGYYAQKGVSVDPERVFLTASTSEAYMYLYRLLTNPGDTVVFPSPSYPLFQFLVELNDLNLEYFSLRYEAQRWGFESEALNRVMDGAKVLTIVNPNNPTGHFITEAERDVMNAACRQRGVPIICDEVFLDYSWDSARPPFSLAQNTEVLTFVLGGLSKTLALPQMKLSWIVINGPQHQVEEAVHRLEVIADTFLSVNTPAQNALPAWLALRSGIQQQIMDRIRENRVYLQDRVSREEAIELLNAEAGWYATLRAYKPVDEEQLALDLLKNDRIYIHPGYFFDFDEEGFLVISLLLPEKEFQNGINKVFDRLKTPV